MLPDTEHQNALEELRLQYCPECGTQLDNRINMLLQNEDSLRGNWRIRYNKWRKRVLMRKLIRRENIRSQNKAHRKTALIKYPNMTLDNFAVMTCYFNPTASSRRLENYRKFARGMKDANVHLLTVELAFGNEAHQLGDDWGDVLQVRSDSVLWHKERLLNLGFQRLINEGYEKIAWFDADIEFIGNDWPWRIAMELETSDVCQAFNHVVVNADHQYPHLTINSVKHCEQHDHINLKPVGLNGIGGSTGYGWAARVDFLNRIQLYENAVIGGGDRLMHFANFWHHPETRPHVNQWFNPHNPPCPNCGHCSGAERWQAHFTSWAERWHKAIERKISYADILLTNYYHGPRLNRLYKVRNEILRRQKFDPDNDLRFNTQGCLEWNSDKARLHEDLILYFRQRMD